MTDSNTATIPAIVRERVARGLAWIVEHGAEHGVDLDRVDLDTLDISSPDLCVLGQGHGRSSDGWTGYSAVMRSQWGEGWSDGDESEGDQWTIDHGFAIDYHSPPGVTKALSLAEAWRQAITVHRAGQ